MTITQGLVPKTEEVADAHQDQLLQSPKHPVIERACRSSPAKSTSR
jgi:hypothetical protein